MERILGRLWLGALALPEQFDLPEAYRFSETLLAESLVEAGVELITVGELRALRKVSRSYILSAYAGLGQPV